jgi:hypothetical protein
LTPSRKKPGVAFWATVAVVAVLVYVLSTGPVGLLYHKLGRPHWLYLTESYVYGPLLWTMDNSPAWCRDVFTAYVYWWSPA